MAVLAPDYNPEDALKEIERLKMSLDVLMEEPEVVSSKGRRASILMVKDFLIITEMCVKTFGHGLDLAGYLDAYVQRNFNSRGQPISP